MQFTPDVDPVSEPGWIDLADLAAEIGAALWVPRGDQVETMGIGSTDQRVVDTVQLGTRSPFNTYRRIDYYRRPVTMRLIESFVADVTAINNRENETGNPVPEPPLLPDGFSSYEIAFHKGQLAHSRVLTWPPTTVLMFESEGLRTFVTSYGGEVPPNRLVHAWGQLPFEGRWR